MPARDRPGKNQSERKNLRNLARMARSDGKSHKVDIWICDLHNQTIRWFRRIFLWTYRRPSCQY